MPPEPGASRAARWFVIGGALVFAALLNWSYLRVESRLFGELLREPPLEYRIAAYVLGVLPASWLHPDPRKPSDVALLFLYAFAVVPMVHLGYHFLPWSASHVLAFTVFYTACFAIICLIAEIRPVGLRPIPLSPGLFFGFLALLTIALAGVAAAANNFQLDLSLADVYVRRLAAREVVIAGSLAAYAMAALAMTLVPMTAAAGMAQRRPLLLVAMTAGVVSLFSFTGEKTVAATPLFMALVIWLLARHRRHFTALVLGGLALGIVLSALAWLRQGNGIPAAAFTERLFTANARNASRYFDFFSSHEYYWFSVGILRGIVDAPYSESMAIMLGALHFGPESGANMDANMWASSFGDAGYLGMLLISAAAGMILWAINSAARPAHAIVAFAIGGYVGFVLAESSFPVAMFSGGVLPSLVLLYLLGGVSSSSPPLRSATVIPGSP